VLRKRTSGVSALNVRSELGIEAVARGKARLELAEAEELLVAKILGGRVLLQVSTRDTRESIPLQLAQHGAELARGDDAMQPGCDPAIRSRIA
jgi:hypothetical protein